MQLTGLVFGEWSGTVRDALIRQGVDAVSVDIQYDSTSDFGPHIKGDGLPLLRKHHDIVIAHPECTRLTNAGVRWLHVPPPGKTLEDMYKDMIEGARIFRACMDANATVTIVENPVMHKHAKAWCQVDKADWTCQPWEFGDLVKKRCCFWNPQKNVIWPEPTHDDFENAKPDIHRMPPGPERQKLRSKFFRGIADALAKAAVDAAMRER